MASFNEFAEVKFTHMEDASCNQVTISSQWHVHAAR